MDNSLKDDLVRLILQRTGIRVRETDEAKFFDTVAERTHVSGCADAQAYAQLLKAKSPAAEHEWRALAAHITVGESYFFRDEDQMALLENWILPELIERQRPQRSLRLWSAGCSTGEEAYTLAMLVQRVLPKRVGWTLDILGTDLNQEALDKAVVGEYGAWSFRRVAPALKRRFFRQRGQRWRVNSELRGRVTFRCHNLKSDPCPDLKNGLYDVDLIVCRNVLIYFDPSSATVVLNKLTNSLKPGGYLLTGHTELYAHTTPGLRARTFSGSLIYEREAKAARRVSPSPEVRSLPQRVALPPPAVALETPSPSGKPHEAAQRGGDEAKETPRVRDASERVEALVLVARRAANVGDYARANALCQRALNGSPFEFEVYFLMAQLAEAQQQTDLAKTCFKKVLYLRPDYVAAYVELGALYEREGDVVRARKARAGALDLLETYPPGATVSPYEALSAEEIVAHLEGLERG